MRRLLLIRHSKSSWKFPELADHERPLNKRGQRDVPLMAKHLKKKPEAVDKVFSSTAVRAIVLAEAIGKALKAEVEPRDTLYTFSQKQLWHCLRELPDAYSALAVVGHNPAITEVVQQLGLSNIDNVPTSAVVSLSFDCDQWSAISADLCTFNYFDYPKQIKPMK